MRLAHAADLPSPDELIRKIQSEGPSASTGAPQGNGARTSHGGGGARAQSTTRVNQNDSSGARASATGTGPSVVQSQPQEAAPAPAALNLATFDDVLALIDSKRNIRLRTDVDDYVHLVAYEPGRIEFRPAKGAPDDLAGRISQTLQHWTGGRWIVSLSNEKGAPTVTESRKAARADKEATLRQHPLVAAAFATFPGAKIIDMRDAHIPTFDVEDENLILDDEDDDQIDF